MKLPVTVTSKTKKYVHQIMEASSLEFKKTKYNNKKRQRNRI